MHKWAKQIMECVKAKVEAIGLDNFEGQNLDDLKDFTEIAKNIACFDKDYRIVEAMEKSEDNEDIMRMVEQYEDYPDRRFYDNYRYANGRFAPKGRGTRRGFRENCLTNRLIDTKQAVGLIAIQNREYGWNDAGGATAGGATIALTASDVRKLLESNCAKLPDNSAQAEAIEVDCTMSNCTNNSNNLGQAENVGNKALFDGNNTE